MSLWKEDLDDQELRLNDSLDKEQATRIIWENTESAYKMQKC